MPPDRTRVAAAELELRDSLELLASEQGPGGCWRRARYWQMNPSADRYRAVLLAADAKLRV